MRRHRGTEGFSSRNGTSIYTVHLPNKGQAGMLGRELCHTWVQRWSHPCPWGYIVQNQGVAMQTASEGGNNRNQADDHR